MFGVVACVMTVSVIFLVQKLGSMQDMFVQFTANVGEGWGRHK